ncbi:bifunctional phosphopantothenoylcysteine decarboxylase/phosphopantothenate--cysteine ligase CoaBC [Natronospora cellulosivora (SeqCode)]
MKKNILLGVTGGIAVYKVVDLASKLVKAGYNVKTVMTKSATEFVTPLTFQNITHNPVGVDLFSSSYNYEVKHISLSDWADLAIIAPATANFIGKIANGIADDLLTTVIMATEAPVLIAPSMNCKMYANPIVQDNISYLKEKNYHIIEPGEGYLACGYSGQGRLPEPLELLENVNFHSTKKDLQGKKILITAGPTREAIDPIRFISNRSSGKMGYAIAREAAYRGAEVTLVSGPVNLEIPYHLHNLIQVKTAVEMYDAVHNEFDKQDMIIMTAAVGDYRPKDYKEKKIKKDANKSFELKLAKNPDILASLGEKKKDNQLLIGFAAEDQDIIENGEKKLKAKNLDMIVANNISAFDSEDNQAIFIKKDSRVQTEKMQKSLLAEMIVDEGLNLLNK